jgi:hypothetical protein
MFGHRTLPVNGQHDLSFMTKTSRLQTVDRFGKIIGALAAGGERRYVLAELHDFLADLAPDGSAVRERVRQRNSRRFS